MSISGSNGGGGRITSAARFTLRVVACGNAFSLAFESHLGRSFSSLPVWAEYLIADSFESSRTFESDGGGGRIRTFEVDDGRFTVCSLWPLGNPTRGNSNFEVMLEMVVGEGFEPSKSIQSAPFGRSGTPPRGNAFTGLLPYREAGRIISNDAPL